METGWLIEKGKRCLGTAHGEPNWVAFTDEGAIRFARKQDAEGMLASIRAYGGGRAFMECIVSEHSWG